MKPRYIFLVLSVLILSCVTPPWLVTVSETPTIHVSETKVVKQVSTSTPSPTVSTPSAYSAKILLPLVNVRKSPNGETVDTLKAGDFVEILSCSANWCKIKDPPGYVWRGCLSDNPDKLKCLSK